MKPGNDDRESPSVQCSACAKPYTDADGHPFLALCLGCWAPDEYLARVKPTPRAGVLMPARRARCIAKLREIRTWPGSPTARFHAVAALLELINDPAVEAAYEGLPEWH